MKNLQYHPASLSLIVWHQEQELSSQGQKRLSSKIEMEKKQDPNKQL